MELLVLRFEFLTAQHSPQVTVQQLFPVIECEPVQQQGQPLGVVVAIITVIVGSMLIMVMTMSIMRIMRMMTEMMVMINESFRTCC